jgi:membrane-associated phospholipid phosphatase
MRLSARALVRAVSIVASIAPAAHAAAGEGGERFAWRPHWPKFSVAEGVVTGSSLAAGFAFQLAAVSRTEGNWDGPILFDDAVRSGLVAGNRDGRLIAGRVSDVLSLWNVTQPFLVDPLIVGGAGSWGTSLQLSLIATEAIGISALLSRGLSMLTARARPMTPDCKRDGGYDSLCGAELYASFPSGHAAFAFTGAGLVCASHRALPIWGGGLNDGAACWLSISTATMSGVLRIAADRHWVSDVVFGAATGFAIGYLVPTLLHFKSAPKNEARADALRMTAMPMLTGETLGVTALGTF